MQKQARIIVQSYHYFSEGIIIFLIVLAVIQFSDAVEAAYWPYLVLLLLSAMIFSLIALKELPVIFYMLLIPLLGLALHFFQYPIALAIIFAFLLPYRYWRIERTEVKRREATYLSISGLLVAYLIVVNGDHEIVWMFIIQFILTFIGYYYANLQLVAYQEKNNFLGAFSKILGGILFATVAAYFFLSEIIGRLLGFLWQGVAFLTAEFASIFISLFSSIEPASNRQGAEVDDGIFATELGESAAEGVQSYAAIFLIITFAIILISVIYLFIKLRSARREEDDQTKEAEYQISEDKANYGGNRSETSLWRRFFKKPDHPVRKLVFQFEKKLAKTENARRPHETIENWLERIGTGSELEVYQKVRYGNGKVSGEELDELKSELQGLEYTLKEAR